MFIQLSGASTQFLFVCESMEIIYIGNKNIYIDANFKLCIHCNRGIAPPPTECDDTDILVGDRN